jgi:hypothetical protein
MTCCVVAATNDSVVLFGKMSTRLSAVSSAAYGEWFLMKQILVPASEEWPETDL